MSKWRVLYAKEMLEMWRSGKWLWVPVVFAILGVSNPITSYYLPDILKNAGSLPEGAVIQIPMPTPDEVMAKTLSQYATMGVLILVLATMGVVSSERTSGVASMIMVKPVRPSQYLTAKWAGMLSLAGVSYLLGYGCSWYYTEVLIGPVDPVRSIQAFAVWGLWLAFVMTVTLLASSRLRSGGAAAFVALFVSAVLSIVSGLFSKYMNWTPGRLADHASNLLTNGTGLSAFPWSIVCTLGMILLLLGVTVRLFRSQELTE